MLGLFSLKNPRFRLLVIITAVLLLAISIGLAVYVFLPKNKDGVQHKEEQYVSTPPLVGRDMAKAKAAAEASGLMLEIDRWVTSKVYPKNFVTAQKPLPNVRVRKGSRVTVKVSGGKDYVESGRRANGVVVSDDVKPLPSPPIQPSNRLQSKVVVIDPGHQRRANLKREPVGPGSNVMKEKVQGGTSGVRSKTPEYQVTLEISKRLKSALEAHGIKVVMVRETHDVDISNAERAHIANNAHADLFVRIHADGDTDPKKNGISTLYPAPNPWTVPIYDESLKAAKIVQHEAVATTKRKDNGIVARNDISGFNWSKVPVILIETGFMTNPEEDALLNSPGYQDLLASGIAEGIADYLKQVN